MQGSLYLISSREFVLSCSPPKRAYRAAARDGVSCYFIFSTLFVLWFFQCAFAAELWEPWDSPEGLSRLQNSEAKENFWKLVRFYDSQINTSYCGIAAAIMVLNALEIESDDKPQFLGKYPMFTQSSFFSESINAIMKESEVMERGVSLEDLTKILMHFPIQVFKYEVEGLLPVELYALLVPVLKDPNQCVLALYCRKGMNQDGEGHWAPLAAYDAKSDSFLVLDVAKFKYPPAWLDAKAFFSAMQTTSVFGLPRGFIIVKKENFNRPAF